MLVGVLVVIALLVYCHWYKVSANDQSSTAEKRSLHELSYSDADESDTNLKEKGEVHRIFLFLKWFILTL